MTDYKANVCKQTNEAGVSSLTRTEGQRLWDTAVHIAQSTLDDRGLYWGRQQMGSVISRFNKFAINEANILRTLERTTRGMESANFTLGKKVFVSGFDPFCLDTDPAAAARQPRLTPSLFRGNPSGASALRMDGKPVNGAEVQAVIFPPRTTCVEKVTATAPPTDCPSTGPTPGSIAVEGSGGGYLSNEIAYRVTRLRDAIGVTTPAGHIHTKRSSSTPGAGNPGFDESHANDLRAILSNGIGALP